MARVTVLIGSYRSPYLPATLASVQAQTCGDVEVLVLDDANDEDTRQHVKTLDDDRFTHVPRSQRLGPAQNHAAGIREATGEFITILNHDDLWTPEVLATLVAGLDAHPDAIAAFSIPQVVDSDGKHRPDLTAAAWKVWHHDTLPHGLIPDFLALPSPKLDVPLGVSTLVRADVLKQQPIPAWMGGAYDYWLGYRLARLRRPVLRVADSLAFWREHPGNLTRRQASGQAAGERLRLNATVALDHAVPVRYRMLAARKLPRSAAAVTKARLTRR